MTRVEKTLGIKLENVEENPGRRQAAKTCLNNLWGKFGQRLNMSKSEIVHDVKRAYVIPLDDRLDNINYVFLNYDDVIRMTYNFQDQYVVDFGSTNIFVAAFTTANARLRLYDMLDRLGDRVVYYDTDSFVYIVGRWRHGVPSTIGAPELTEDTGLRPASTVGASLACEQSCMDDLDTVLVKKGCMLGDWGDELGKDVYINYWASTGLKSYGYRTTTGKKVSKMKGFTLNFKDSLKLNIKSMENILLRCEAPEWLSSAVRPTTSKGLPKNTNGLDTEDTRPQGDKICVHFNNIVRDSKTKRVLNKSSKRQFRNDYDKRVVCKVSSKLIDTLPYGF